MHRTGLHHLHHGVPRRGGVSVSVVLDDNGVVLYNRVQVQVDRDPASVHPLELPRVRVRERLGRLSFRGGRGVLETPLAPHEARQLAPHVVVDIRLRRFLVGPLDEVAYVNSHGLYVVPPQGP